MSTGTDEKSKLSAIVHFLLACAVFALAVLIVFGGVLFKPGVVVSYPGTDIWRQFYGWRQFGFDELAGGHLALWNPYIFCGAPYMGGFQSALLYPPNWLYLIFRSTAVAINVGVALHVFLSGAFMYCWSAYRRLHWLACVVGGLVFMFGGPQMGQILAGHLPNACALIWAPLIFLAIDDLVSTGSPRAIFLGSAAVALQVLAGHPQYVFFTAIGTGIYLLLQLFITEHRLKAVGGFFVFYCFGALLAAVQLLTGLQATGEAMRTKLSYDFVSTFSFPPEDLLTAILPRFFGDLANVPYWGRWFYWEMSAYVGVTAVVLALLAFGVPSRQRRFAFTMLILLFVLALGKYTPVGEVIFRLPGFDSFRGISKFMFLVMMFLAMLSAMGFDWLLRGGQVRRWFVEYLGWAAVLFIIAGITILVSAKAEWSGWWGQMLHGNNWTYHPLKIDLPLLHQTAKASAMDLFWAAGACIVIGALIIAGRRWPRAHWAIAAVAAVELMVFAQGIHSSFQVDEMMKEVQFVDTHFGDDASQMRTWTYEQGAFLTGRRLNSWGDDPMMLRRYVELMASAFGWKPERLLTEMPTDYKNLSSPAWKLTRTAWLFISSKDGLTDIPNPRIPLPRASLIGNVTVEPDRAKLLARLNSEDFDPHDDAIVESPITPVPAGGYDLGRVDVHEFDTDTLDIEAWTSAPCLLLITDAYSTGWHAEPEPGSVQQSYEVMPADLAFRGVPLTVAGHHHFRMVYRPTAFVVGKWVTLAALALYFGALIFWVARGRIFIDDDKPAVEEPTGSMQI